MEDYRYIYFLVEDQSGGTLIDKIMQKYQVEKQTLINYNIKFFKGIGRIPKKIKK